MSFNDPDDGDFSSGEDNDDVLDEDMEALRQACMLTDANPYDLNNSIQRPSPSLPATGEASGESDKEDSEDDLEVLRSIQNRFSISAAFSEPLSLKPLMTLPPDSDNDDDDDFATLAAIRRRFAAYDDTAQLFVATIRKNRSCQKLLRSKLTEIEARMEENKKLRERVQILKNFHVSWKKMTGKALKDPLIQLISARKAPTSEDSEINDKRVSTIRDGPLENSHAANYRKALKNFPLIVHRKKWAKTESKNLGMGIRQQFQEMVLHLSVDQFSGSEGYFGDHSNLDSLLASIRDLEITPELMREFLPKVNWDQLASLYVTGRSGAECAARWLNFEDPLIDSSPWEARDDKNLLLVVQERGISNWFDIAASLEKKRTPFGCLLRFQRSLNARILKKEWTKDEDAQLNAAVKVYGYNWQDVASCLEGRTGAQCSNRWRKSLNPYRQRKGTWTLDEDKCLKVAVKFFGPKNWNKIAQFVPGRTQVQCRERWFNALDPSLNTGEWSEEEDLRLKAIIEECGYGWAEIAKHFPGRTDSCCRRRWRLLAPHEVPKMQEAYRTKKAAFIGNFVDRELERPALSADDFLPLPAIGPASEPENLKPGKHKQKSRNKCRRTNGNFKSLLLQPPERLELDVTNNDGSLSLVRNDTPETVSESPDQCIGRKHKSCQEVHKSCQEVHNNPSGTICDNSELVHDNVDSSLLAITSGDARDILCHPNASSKKKTSKMRIIKEMFLERINAEMIENSPDGIALKRQSKEDKKYSRGERRHIPSE
ncbi:hypothetical protein K2173_028233 [Erythroxylum novogranatense]|uniref:Uncharacterized protein n=1 Tax=Erythroxylum novogranatense TaxID=1862640 RepID=A0AAV8U2K7_9ROSI|nr:hypothetical protein K2173_028233 [Erythroxylum novogranatense]